MYSVSQAYTNKLFDISKKRRAVTAFLDGVSFNENDIVSNSLKYTMQAVGGAEINLGGVFLGQLWLTFISDFASNVPRGTWKGKKINLSIGLEITDGQIEYVPIGEFFIEEANHVTNGVEITAYDAMRKFDKTLNLSSTSGGMYAIINMACRKCDVELGMTREEIESMTNGSEVFTIYPENDMKTYRDLLSWCGATMCSFATITRDGKLVFRSWHSESDLSLGINDRYAKGSFSDFRTFYTGISVTNIADETTSYYNVVPDRGLTMNIGANPFLQYGLPEAKERTRRAILTGLGKFNYTPFKVSAFADPFIDLGDVITFTQGLAGSSCKGCVMRIDYSFSKGITLQGYGKNPALFGAQSKTDKNISGLMSKTEGMETKFEVYTNSEELVLGTPSSSLPSAQWYLVDNAQVCELTFATSKDSVVEINTNIQLKFLIQRVYSAYNRVPFIDYIKVKFYLNEDEVTEWRHIPLSFFGNPDASAAMELLTQAFEIPVNHYLPLLNIKGGDVNTLKVFIEFSVRSMRRRQVSESSWVWQDEDEQGKLFIEPNELMVTLRGQGLVVEKPWDGFIIVSDDGIAIPIGSIAIENIEDEGEITLVVPIILEERDEIEPIPIGAIGIEEIEDEVEIILARPTCGIITEDALYNFVTEDENYVIVTE